MVPGMGAEEDDSKYKPLSINIIPIIRSNNGNTRNFPALNVIS